MGVSDNEPTDLFSYFEDPSGSCRRAAPSQIESLFLNENFGIHMFMFKPIRQRGQDMFETHVEELVRPDHPYRKLRFIVDFKKLCKPLRSLFCVDRGRKGYHIESGFAAFSLDREESLLFVYASYLTIPQFAAE